MLGINLYLICFVLCVFDTAKPVLEHLQIKKLYALLYCGIIMLTGLLEDIFISSEIAISFAGFIMPLLLCAYLLVRRGLHALPWLALYIAVAAIAAWASVQLFSQSLETAGIGAAWIRGSACTLITLLFTQKHAAALLCAMAAFFLSGLACHVDLLLSGVRNYWAVGSGLELAVSAAITIVSTGMCQLILVVSGRHRKWAMPAKIKA